MDVFDVNGQWFEPNTNRDSLRPNSPKMKIYQQVDDKLAMLTDDLEKEEKERVDSIDSLAHISLSSGVAFRNYCSLNI